MDETLRGMTTDCVIWPTRRWSTPRWPNSFTRSGPIEAHQKQLAELVGTTQSMIASLEDADYEGHSLSMLQRIATAVKMRLEVRFVSVGRKAMA